MEGILGVKLNNISREEALKKVVGFIGYRKGEVKSVYFLNMDCLFKAQKDERYRSILNRADMVLSDGIGLKVVMQLFNKKLHDNCNGTDFSPLIFSVAEKNQYRIFLLGGKEGVAETAAMTLKKKFPNLCICGVHHGYDVMDDVLVERINRSQADILFVGMGAPVQEKWIDNNKGRLNVRLSIGVGGLFDYWAGNIIRAPYFIRLLKLEWLWRVLMEPKRLWKRYFVDGLYFLLTLLVNHKELKKVAHFAEESAESLKN